jgi:hypothetical protein
MREREEGKIMVEHEHLKNIFLSKIQNLKKKLFLLQNF